MKTLITADFFIVRNVKHTYVSKMWDLKLIA